MNGPNDAGMGRAAWPGGLDFCGRRENPGLAVDFNPYVDYSSRATTEDQRRIEDYLHGKSMPAAILHIGVGNSEFAQTFTKKGARVVGVTVSQDELRHAENLCIKGYETFLCNKYHHSLADVLRDKKFDYIVDNNLAAFACCRYHLTTMLQTYLHVLKPRGWILTDQRGMDWALSDPAFILDLDGLHTLATQHCAHAVEVADQVYGIQHNHIDKESDQRLRVFSRRAGRVNSFYADD